jgi:hypothetical protein
MWHVCAVIYVGGFAFVLAIFAILQVMKVVMDGEVAPKEANKVLLSVAAAWPIFALAVVFAGLFPSLLRPKVQGAMMETGIKKKNYAFTVEVLGEKWDCYYFKKDGKDGTMAFTKRQHAREKGEPSGEHFVIGLFRAGRLTEAQAKTALEETAKKEQS